CENLLYTCLQYVETRIGDPFITLLYATPRISLIPLIIIWLGIGLWSKVAVVFLGAIFPIIINTTGGFRTLDESLLKAARSFGADNWIIFRTIGLPGSVPFIISGLRLGLGRGLVGIVVAEMFASQAGIGYLIMLAGSSFQTDTVFVGVGIIAGSALLLDSALRMLERRFESWRV
ncbi:ABC transporter permease, partial [Thermodesulfobacteriota bacterium]